MTKLTQIQTNNLTVCFLPVKDGFARDERNRTGVTYCIFIDVIGFSGMGL